MTTLLVAARIGVVVIVGLKLLLPYPACRTRRERTRKAYARWREMQDPN